MERTEQEQAAYDRIKQNLMPSIDKAIEIIGELTAERRTTQLTIPTDSDRDEDFVLVNTLEAAKEEIELLRHYEIYLTRERAEALLDINIDYIATGLRIVLSSDEKNIAIWGDLEDLVAVCIHLGEIVPHYHEPLAHRLRKLLKDGVIRNTGNRAT